MIDILDEIPDESLPRLASLYQNHVKWAPHVLSLIHTGMRWKQSTKYRSRVTFMSPSNAWERDGTIIVLIRCHSYDIFVFTLDHECTNLRRGLTETTLINYKDPQATFFCVHEKHIPTITQLAIDKNFKLSRTEAPFVMFALHPQKVDDFAAECPQGFCVKRVDVALAGQIDAVWPHRFPGSRDYLAALIEINGGYGLFVEETGEMVAWVLKHCLGHLGMLQTEEGHKKKGYAMVVAKALAREIVEEGQWPFATVYGENQPSIRMFEKLGFHKIGTCTYLGVNNE